MKRLRVFVQDSPARRMRGRDEILSADPIPKLMLMPMTWQGDLRPVLDAYLEQLRPLENGLTLGRTLSAEEIGHVLDMGRTWLGNFQTKLLAASADFATARRPEEAGSEPGTDVAEVAAQLDRLRRDMGTADRAKIADSVRRLRDAAARVSDEAERQGAFSEGRRIADGLMRPRMVGDFSKPVSIATINQHNRQFHDRHSVSPHVDSSGRMRRTGDARPNADTARQTALRDAIHAQAQARTPGGRLRAMNDAARAFWPSTGVSPAEPVGRLPAPVGKGAAEINARNRLFWAARS